MVIPADRAIAIRRPKGSTVTLVNQSAVNVFIDSDYNRLNASLAGAIPSGTLLAAAGGQVQITDYPGVYYARAAVETTLEVQP